MNFDLDTDVRTAIRQQFALYRSQTSWRRRTRLWIARIVRRLVESHFCLSLLDALQPERKVLRGYDQMSGSYNREIAAWKADHKGALVVSDATYQIGVIGDVYERYLNFIFTEVLQPLVSASTSLIEVGSGELSTLVPFLKHIKHPLARVAAIDISWSRLTEGRRFAQEQGVAVPHLIVGSALNLPLATASFEVLAPNGLS